MMRVHFYRETIISGLRGQLGAQCRQCLDTVLLVLKTW